MMVGRNEKCPCGSGKKSKKCCFRRDHKPASEWKKPHRQEVFEQIRRATPKFRCLAPVGNVGTTCQEETIASHSVTRGRELAGIAENNHVLGFNVDASAILRGGVQQFRALGIKQASTFPGFCNTHDNDIFLPIDTEDWDGSEKQSFLLCYRTLCKEIHARRLGNEAIIPMAHQHAHPTGKDLLDDFSTGSCNAMRNLSRTKDIADAAFLSETYTCYSEAFSLGSDFPLRAAGAFHPETDFSGNRCLSLGSATADYPLLCVTTHTTDSDVLAVFIWFEQSGEISQFLDSFRNLSPELRRSAFVQLCFENFENMFARPSWWCALSPEKRQAMEKRFNAGLNPLYDRKLDCLIPEVTFSGI